MKRVWNHIEHLDENAEKQLLSLFFHYDVCIAYYGSGWAYGTKMGFGTVHDSLKYLDTGLNNLRMLQDDFEDYIFGHAGYDLKTETAGADNHYSSEDGFSHACFFVPKIVIEKRGSAWWAGYLDQKHFAELLTKLETPFSPATHLPVELKPVTDRKEYERNCNSLLHHIQRGDIYEVNYCIDFIGSTPDLDPVSVFCQLTGLADAPMSALYKNGRSWLMCASPERYVMRKGNKIISQPIKGTIRRGKSPEEDAQLMEQLRNDPKERSENVMIIDLVRNDLSRFAKKGTVRVTERFGVHTFKTVHQMISTVECEADADTDVSRILRCTFPMGSMTGAPKYSALKLADEQEGRSRGIFSGTVGYILPNGDFDFNVVIRSIMWNSGTGHLSVKAGSAITANSIPEKEYEECLLKAEAMMNALKRSED